MGNFGTPITEVRIYTDGGSRGNGSEDSVGAIGYVIEYEETTYEGSKTFDNVTNNQMELTAAIEALKTAKSLVENNKRMKIMSDSSYVINGITSWRYGWQNNNWMNSKKKPVLNMELWKELCDIADSFSHLKWEWIKAHQEENNGNDRADELCNIAMDNYIKESENM